MICLWPTTAPGRTVRRRPWPANGRDWKSSIASPDRIQASADRAGGNLSQILLANEQVEPWASIVVAADGKVSTYSPEFMEVTAPDYDNFVFGNVLDEDIDDFANNPAFRRAAAEIEIGVAACKLQCRYFAVCGGGAPVNKYCE